MRRVRQVPLARFLRHLGGRLRLAVYAFGSWGVPSFRLLDEHGEQALALWAQDRLWLVSREIQRLIRRWES